MSNIIHLPPRISFNSAVGARAKQAIHNNPYPHTAAKREHIKENWAQIVCDPETPVWALHEIDNAFRRLLNRGKQ